MVERQGKQFVLYAGLLSLAHEQGLKSITTSLIQIPSEANNRVAICTATVVLEKDGVERVFTGIGDAAPNNVAPAMQTCLIRMAETRAKARALRDAVNIGVAAFEELGEEDATDSAPERGYAGGSRNGRSAPYRTPQPSGYGNNGNGNGNGNGHGALPVSAKENRAPAANVSDNGNGQAVVPIPASNSNGNGNGAARTAPVRPVERPAERPAEKAAEGTPIPQEMQHPAMNPILDAQAEAIKKPVKAQRR